MADLSSPVVPYLPTPREGPSPFLEGTCIQYAWDSTCLGALKKCGRFYQLSIIEGWRSRDDNVHLTFGIRYTETLEHYDKLRAQENFDHDWAVGTVVWETMNKTWIEDTDPEGNVLIGSGRPWQHGATDEGIGNKNRYTLIRSIVWYLDQFKDDPAKTVIAEDGTPLVERSFRMELDWGPSAKAQLDAHYKTEGLNRKIGSPLPAPTPYLLCGHLDRVVTFLGGVYVMDHKTTKTTVSDYYFDQYEPNNQMSLYTLAGKTIFKSPIKGVIIDVVQVAVGFSRFARGMTYRTEAQLTEWLRDLRYHLDAAERFATDGYWPMNDTACFNCQFNRHDGKICGKDPAVRQAFLESHFTKENPWNPLKVRN